MVEGVRKFLKPVSGGMYLDLTIGTGGHAEVILSSSSPDGYLVGVDRDILALEIARGRLSRFEGRFEVHNMKFSEFGEYWLRRRGNIKELFDGIVADFGLSSIQLEESGRGFSFLREGPLDMRMDCRQSLTAYELVNKSSLVELESIIRRCGQERKWKKVARVIFARSRQRPIETTTELAQLVRGAVGQRRAGKVDSATRVFQAIRIAVNDELGEIKKLMSYVFNLLKSGGVFIGISYHSLEDRIVKEAIKKGRRAGYLIPVVKKVVFPSRQEIMDNPRARSARMRVVKKL